MAVLIKVTRARTIQHLDATSATHARDQMLAREAREKKFARRSLGPVPRVAETLKFPTLSGGLLLAPDGRELSPGEHHRLLQRMVSERSYYFQSETRADGRPRIRRKKTAGVRSLAVTFRPDYAAFLAVLDRTRPDQNTRPFVIDCAKMVSREFEAATGLEVVSVQVHPEESVLHLHVTFATVDSKNRLLWAASGRGRKGLRLAGPWHVGCLRLANAGYIAPQDGRLAEMDIGRIVQRHGEEPVDWRLSVALDEKCAQFVDRRGLQDVFAVEVMNYAAEVRKRRAALPRNSEAARATAEHELEALRTEVLVLRGRLAAALKALSSLHRVAAPKHPFQQPLIRSL